MKTPFGNTGAAVKLAEIVETNPRSRRYVSSTLSELGSILHNIIYIKEMPVRRYLTMVVRDQFIQRIKQSGKLSEVEASFLANVITTKCRSFKKSFDQR